MYAFLWMYIIPLTLVLLVTLVKHASYGFSEEIGHWIMSPFFKDHTSYGAVIALFVPIVVSMTFDKEKTAITRSIIFVILIIFSIALFYSSTRAAWASVVGAGMVYLLFMFKIKFKYLFISGLLIGFPAKSFPMENSWSECTHSLPRVAFRTLAHASSADIAERAICIRIRRGV